MPLVFNPYTEPYQAAIKAEDDTKTAELYTKWCEWNAAKLAELETLITHVETQAETFEEEHKVMSYSKQYKAAINLYQRARDLMLLARELKRTIRGTKK